MLEPAVRGESLLQVDHVSLTLQGRTILDQVSFEIQSGEILTLIGPNGAGKTTLLRVALGLQTPDSGRVQRLSGLRFGYLPQRLPVDDAFPLTVQRFLLLGEKHDKERLLEVLAEVGAERLLNSPLQGLSGGELQRVLLARALLREPDLLVLDEPVQGVDVNGQVEIFRLLTRIRDQRGCAILMVSHDLHLVMASTDRVICLNRHVCCTGTPEAVSQNTRFLDLFGPAAVLNLAIYSHDREHRHEDCCNPEDRS